jgi:hypothetical protein
LAEQGTNLPKFKFDHLLTMMDTIGMYQRATFSIPNFIDGYCTDDNARCLILTVLLEKLEFTNKEIDSISSRCMAFIAYAYNSKKHSFRNFMTFDRKWTEDIGSEDSQGRAFWALGVCIGRSEKSKLQKTANNIWDDAINAVHSLKSIRSCAFTLLGIYEYLKRLQGDTHISHLRDILIQKLVHEFNHCASDDWLWFENVVSYSNAKIPHALILNSQNGKNKEALSIGLKSLRWLISIQTSEKNNFRPIGYNGFYKRNDKQAAYDQQPIEIYAMVSACIDAYLITKDDLWFKQAHTAFDWFLGRNDLGAPMYDPKTGGCKDAMLVDRVNENQGAESTLSFLLSLAEMQLMQNDQAAFIVNK